MWKAEELESHVISLLLFRIDNVINPLISRVLNTEGVWECAYDRLKV